MTNEVETNLTEDRFENWRRTTGLFLGPIVFLLLYFIPISSLTLEAHRLAAVLGFVIIFWISDAIPIPVPILSMIKAGIIFDIIGFFIILGGLMILCPLMGWA